MASSRENLEQRLAAAGSVTEPELLLEYQRARQAAEPATNTSAPAQQPATGGNDDINPTGAESAQGEGMDTDTGDSGAPRNRRLPRSRPRPKL